MTATDHDDHRARTSAASHDAAQLLRVWLSPSFPTGAFAYSHGLETAVARRLVTTADDLGSWIEAVIERGSLRSDLILLGEAWRAAAASDIDALTAINATALALQPSAERYLEAAQQGGSFATTIAAAWPCAPIENLRRAADTIALPVAIGAAAAGHDIALEETLAAYALAFATNLVSAAIRLSVTGQTDGQRIIARLLPAIERQATAAITRTLADLGTSAFSADLASIEHETLPTRLFRS